MTTVEALGTSVWTYRRPQASSVFIGAGNNR
jgi:hypothetical protein